MSVKFTYQFIPERLTLVYHLLVSLIFFSRNYFKFFICFSFKTFCLIICWKKFWRQLRGMSRHMTFNLFSYKITFDEKLKTLFCSMNGKLLLTNVYQNTFLENIGWHSTFYCKSCGKIPTNKKKNTQSDPKPGRNYVK